jgi:hypothetical protein
MPEAAGAYDAGVTANPWPKITSGNGPAAEHADRKHDHVDADEAAFSGGPQRATTVKKSRLQGTRY